MRVAWNCCRGQLPSAWTKLDGEDERDDAAGNAGDADRRTQKRHDSGAVAARYKHAFGGLSVRFFVGQMMRPRRRGRDGRWRPPYMQVLSEGFLCERRAPTICSALGAERAFP